MTYDDLLKLAQQGARGFTTGLLGGPVDLANMAMANAGGDKPVMGSKWIGEKLQNIGLLAEEPKDTAGSVAEFAGGLLGPGAPVKAAAAIKGPALAALMFHGSPHKFDKFDISKLGAGEGAQVYGHGLYFADNPEVAKHYQNIVGKEPTPEQRASRLLGSGVSEENVLAALQRLGLDDGAAASALKGGQESKGGHFYRVDVPDEAVANMLHWDEPLTADAPQQVKDAFNSITKKYPELKDKFYQAFIDKQPGSHYYSLLNDHAKTGDLAKNQAFASEVLRKAGIPGIRYLDQGSRGRGGTYNTVLFDDALAKILSRE